MVSSVPRLSPFRRISRKSVSLFFHNPANKLTNANKNTTSLAEIALQCKFSILRTCNKRACLRKGFYSGDTTVVKDSLSRQWLSSCRLHGLPLHCGETNVWSRRQITVVEQCCILLETIQQSSTTFIQRTHNMLITRNKSITVIRVL